MENSLDKPYICFSDEISNSLKELKDFNRDRIYMSETFFKQTAKLELMFSLMFERYYEDLKNENRSSEICGEYLRGMSEEYRETSSIAMVVRDFIAGMTDEYFLSQCRKYLFPEIKTAPLQSYGYTD